MRKTIICVLAIFLTLNLSAQTNYEKFKIGEPFPEFTLRNMKYFPTTEIPVSALKGRYTIIDVFNKGCVSCVESWPHSKIMYERFKKDLDIILLGIANSEDDIRGTQEMYETFRKKLNLTFPVAFDSTVPKRFGFAEGPKLFWIDNKGIIKAITSSGSLTPENIKDFLADKEFEYYDKTPNKQKNTTVFSKPVLVKNNGGIDSNFLYRSIIYKHDWNNFGLIITDMKFQTEVNPGLYQTTHYLLELYKLAYFGRSNTSERDVKDPQMFYGKFSNDPVLNVSDSSWFFSKNKMKKIYGYSLTYPKKNADTSFIKSNMQFDLKRQFGYNVKIEERLCPYLRLELLNKQAEQKLLTKYSNLKDEDIISGSKQYDLNAHNFPIRRLIFSLNNWGTTYLPIEDMTGINGNIDVDLKCVWTNFLEVKKALNKAGLDLVEDKKLMKVLVINDPISSNNKN